MRWSRIARRLFWYAWEPAPTEIFGFRAFLIKGKRRPLGEAEGASLTFLSFLGRVHCDGTEILDNITDDPGAVQHGSNGESGGNFLCSNRLKML